jgi:O-antigen ligase
MSSPNAALRSVAASAAVDDFEDRLHAEPVFVAAQIAFGLKLALTVLVFDPQAFDAFSLVKSAVGHSLSLVLVVLLLGLVAVRGRRVLIWSPLHVLIGLLVIAYAASSALALDLHVALFGAWRRYLGLTQMLDGAAVYAGAVLLVRDTRDLMRLGIVTLATAAVVLLYMIVQQFGLDPVTYIQGPNLRPFGAFGQPDLAGGYTGVIAVTALAIAWRLPDVRWRAGAVGVAGISLVAMLLTNVRGGLLAVGVGFVALVAIVLWHQAPSRQVLARLGAAALVALVVILASPLRSRLFFDVTTDLSLQSRLDTWGTALGLMLQRPLFGLGPDNFAIAYPAARTERSVFLNAGELQNSTHNWLLQVGTSVGFVGLLIFLAMLALSVVLAARLARRDDPTAIALVPLAAFFGQGLVTIGDPSLDWIPWLAVGLIAGADGTRLVASRGSRRARRHAPTFSPRALTNATLVLAAGAALATSAAARDRIEASEHFRLSEAYQDAGRGTEAFTEARAVLALDPRRAEHWSGVGAALNVVNSPIQAGAAFAEAARLGPSQPIFWRNLALMRVRINDPTGAVAAVARAEAADPWDATTRDLSARLSLSLGKTERAASEGHLAARLRPFDATLYETPVQADVDLGRLRDAEDLLRGGLKEIQAPESFQLHILLAQVLARENRVNEARTEIEIALAIKPGDPTALQVQEQIK